MLLELLAGLPNLRSIDFGGTLVSDFALRDMPQSKSLRIFRTLGRRVSIGDRGAISVGTKMPRLITLDLSKTDVGDEGVRGLTHLPLRFLNILGTRMTDAGVASMAGMHSLRKLVLSFTKISDASLYFIQAMPRLNLLMLDGTAVTDEGLSYILKLPSLSALYLNGTHITDNATRCLTQMTQLRVLAVGQQLSPDSVGLLRKALPKCRISAIN
jgi:internalin A